MQRDQEEAGRKKTKNESKWQAEILQSKRTAKTNACFRLNLFCEATRVEFNFVLSSQVRVYFCLYAQTRKLP